MYSLDISQFTGKLGYLRDCKQMDRVLEVVMPWVVHVGGLELDFSGVYEVGKFQCWRFKVMAEIYPVILVDPPWLRK